MQYSSAFARDKWWMARSLARRTWNYLRDNHFSALSIHAVLRGLAAGIASMPLPQDNKSLKQVRRDYNRGMSPDPVPNKAFRLSPNVLALGWVSFFHRSGLGDALPRDAAVPRWNPGRSPALLGLIDGIAEEISSGLRWFGGALSTAIVAESRSYFWLFCLRHQQAGHGTCPNRRRLARVSGRPNHRPAG